MTQKGTILCMLLLLAVFLVCVWWGLEIAVHHATGAWPSFNDLLK